MTRLGANLTGQNMIMRNMIVYISADVRLMMLTCMTGYGKARGGCSEEAKAHYP